MTRALIFLAGLALFLAAPALGVAAGRVAAWLAAAVDEVLGGEL